MGNGTQKESDERMTRWYDWCAACLFAYFIYVNATIAVALFFSGNIVFAILCAVSAYLVNSWWDSWYIPFRVSQEEEQ